MLVVTTSAFIDHDMPKLPLLPDYFDLPINSTSKDLGIDFNARKIESSSPVLMKWTDTLHKRTAAEAREQQIAMTRDHLLRRMWAATGAQVHVTWPDYASQASREAVKEELRNHGFPFQEMVGGVIVEVSAPT